MSRITARRARALTPIRALALAGVAAVVTLASACSSSPSSASDTSAHSSSDVVINLGEQQQQLETLLLSSGVLAGAPYKVNFVDFQSGPLVDSGFAAHRIDVGTMGDLPASLTVSSRLPVVAIAVDQAIGASEYLLAEPGITSIAQLRGKPVAYTTGTAEQAFALRALKSAGMTQKDVHQVNVSLEQLGTALQSGAAVASVVSVEQKADYMVDHPGAKVLANVLTVSPPSYGYLLATKAALAEPAKLTAIEDLTKRIIRAENWEKTHKTEYVTDYYVKVEHQTPAVARMIIAAGGTVTYVPITPAVHSALQGMVNIMAASGGISAAFSVAPLFDQAEIARYNAVVAEVPQNG
jgi:sulfonate transport system substrate-binding protein